VTKKWPATADIGTEDHTVLEALVSQCAPAGYDPNEDAMKLKRKKGF
jgi:hypothetical protein